MDDSPSLVEAGFSNWETRIMTTKHELPQREDSRKAYDTPELSRLGDVEKITQDHVGTTSTDLPLGSADDIKSSSH